MITFTCDKCERRLEVDDEHAGRKVACPHCGDINIAPALVPVARAARSGGGVESAGGSVASFSVEGRRRLEELGLPPDAGPEQTVRKVRPAMFRARPVQGAVLACLLLGGVVGGAIFGAMGQLSPAMACGAAAAAGVVWWSVWKVRTLSTALIITNKRSIHRVGLLSRATREVVHDRVQDVQITQTFMQRLLNVGRIGLSSAGESDVEIEVADLPNPGGLRDVIDAYRNL